MSRNQNAPDNPIGRAIVTAGLIWLLASYQPGPHAHPYHEALWWVGAVVAAIGVLKSLPRGLGRIGDIFKLFRAFGRGDAARGSAGWMSEAEVRKLGLHRRRKGSRFLGTIGKTPLWLWTETAHLILGPAGTQKSTAAILNILCGCGESALINDVKGELFKVVGEYRKRVFGHDVMRIDPRHPEASARINPLDFIAGFVAGASPEALTLARGMVRQLHPDPQGSNNPNQFFYDGARMLLVAVILAVIVVMPKGQRTLAVVYRALNDLSLLEDLLRTAMKSDALNGEVADMASSQHSSAFGDDGTAKTFEQFRLGALQAVEAFGPGNYLARITSDTTFSIADLKSKKLSIFLIIDFANKDVLGKFSGLMQWLAAYQLVSVGNNKPVLFVLDEFCNAPLHVLPTILTLLRTYGVKCILATQDLDDVIRVYSKHALETVLSETDIKQFLGGIRSQTTLEYLSKYLGEYTETVGSWALGRDGVQESLSRTNRRLMSEDELRRLPDTAQIILTGSEKPLLSKKVQIFAVAPWRKSIAPNSLYGGKRKLMPVEVRVGWFGTKVTSRGRRAHARILREIRRKGAGAGWRLFGVFLRGLGGAVPILVVLALILALQVFGAPNLRVDRSARLAPDRWQSCRYLGPTSPGVLRAHPCPRILFRKSW